MRFDNRLRLTELPGRKTGGCGYGNLWDEPEFCLTVRVCYVDVDAKLFPRKEEQPVLTVADDRRCHERNVAEATAGWTGA